MKCKVCHREAKKEGFCPLHFVAYSNVLGKFEVWRSAAGVCWEKYLVEIQKNSLTGEGAKDVIKYLIEEEQRCPVK